MGNGRLPGIYHADAAVGLTDENMTLPKRDVTIAEALKESGYRSLHLG
jgi:arylsulfatase A-like enzyme